MYLKSMEDVTYTLVTADARAQRLSSKVMMLLSMMVAVHKAGVRLSAA
jgi:hypothetical protein